MPTQKIFKQRVRARMAKTGESYAAARLQLLRRASEPAAPDSSQPASEAEPIGAHGSPAADGANKAVQPDAFEVSDDSMLRATGKVHAEWFALLDAWGATDHGHTAIARWLSEAHGTSDWWTQSITVAYERARGMRVRHQMRDGFSVSATRTVAAAPGRALAAFTDAPLRARWLPDAPMRQRPTRAALSARFDWSDPPSRLVVTVVPKGTERSIVAVTHQQLPDAESAERIKGTWRERLDALKATIEQG